ncbi:MAG: hypothetical protein AB3N24_03930 [Leisingera sp.]
MNKLTLDAPVQGPPAPAGSPEAAPAVARKPAQAQPSPQPAPDRKPESRDTPTQPPRLHPAVLAQIATALREGQAPLAAQADLVALHKRIAEMFTTLNQGLGEQAAQKAAADRAALTARIDHLEEAVNRMEGALRIEFEPVLKAAVAEALAQAAPPPRHRGRILAALVLAAAALAAGAWWHAPLQDAAQAAAAALESRTGWQLSAGKPGA